MEPNVWSRPATIPWVRVNIAPNALLVDLLRAVVTASGFAIVAKVVGVI